MSQKPQSENLADAIGAGTTDAGTSDHFSKAIDAGNSNRSTFDSKTDSGKVVILGGGLSGGLLALSFKRLGFENFVLVEKAGSFGGNHTWSFHGTDVEKDDIKWLSPMFHGSWDHQWVHFSEYSRKLPISYHSISSEKFHEHLVKVLTPDQYRLNSTFEIQKNSPDLNSSKSEKNSSSPLNGATSGIFGQITSSNKNESINAKLVFDGTGASHDFYSPCGYQKFVGLEVELEKPHGLSAPIIMDATVPQLDGFRFIYTLPFSNKTLLVEDTRYSLGSKIQVEDFEHEVREYIFNNFGPIKSVLRKEVESLSIPLKPKAFADENGVLQIGLRGGLFHPVTGYSVPVVLRSSKLLAGLLKSGKSPSETVAELARFKSNWGRTTRFLYTLNKMLFGAALDNQRVKIFERFYRLSNDLVGRFYSGNLLARDQVRLLVGRPPVAITRAIKSLTTDSWMDGLR